MNITAPERLALTVGDPAASSSAIWRESLDRTPRRGTTTLTNPVNVSGHSTGSRSNINPCVVPDVGARNLEKEGGVA